MLPLICLGWKLSTRVEYWWWLLCTHPPLFLPLFTSSSPPFSHVFPPHILYILSAQLISCLLSLLPIFTLLILTLFPMQLHFADPNFASIPPLPSIRLCMWPRSLFPAAQSITYHLHYQAQFLFPLPYFNLCVLTNSSLLLLPSAFPCILPVSSCLTSCFCSFSICPLLCSFGGPPAYYLTLFFSVSLCSVLINSWSMWVREVMRCEIWGLYLSVCLWHRERLTHRVTLEDMVLHLHLTPMSTLF